MNKFFSLLSVLLMFTCCAPQERDSADIPVLPYEILAPAGTDSKTATIDNMHIVWELNDALSVFHAPTGTDQYVNDGLFTIDDVSTGHAQGEAAVPDGASDWYFATRPAAHSRCGARQRISARMPYRSWASTTPPR